MALALLAPAGAFAQTPAGPPELRPSAVAASTPNPQPSNGAHPLTAADLDAFLEGVIGQQLARDDIAGAVISIVKDGHVLFEKGFGYADVGKKLPVDPKLTGFRIASTTKTMTGTAVMQLVEQGKLDLDHDVADYLDFPLERRFAARITLRQLLTHTAGFEERGKDFIYSNAQAMPPLGVYLRTHPARQVNLPGATISYSNYGVALAGYIVERVSGRPWAKQVEETIFRPLGMTQTSAEQPLPPALLANLSKEYDRASGQPVALQFIPDAPAGAVTTTADDMTRYMLAHLATSDSSMLKSATLAEMHRRQFGVSPAVEGIAINFLEGPGNGRRVLTHPGDLSRFHSDLWLMPQEQLGLFVSYNSTGIAAYSVRDQLWSAFLNRYYPDTRPPLPTLATAPSDATAVSGNYLLTRIARTTVLAPFYLLGSQAWVKANGDGTITLPAVTAESGVPKRFREIGPLVWQEENGPKRIAFLRSADGAVRTLAGGATLEGIRPPWTLRQDLNLWFYGCAFAVLVLWTVLWPINAVIRWRLRRPLAAELDATRQRQRLLAHLAVLLTLIFLIGWIGFFAMAAQNLSLMSSGADGYLRVMQAIGLLSTVGILYLIHASWSAWQNRAASFFYRLVLTAVALSALTAGTFALRFNVFSPSLQY